MPRARRRRAGYSEQLIEQLASDLIQQFGRGFSRQNQQQMRSFFLIRPIRQTVSGESSLEPVRPWWLDELAQVFTLPWSTYVRLLSVKGEHARQFYLAETLRGGCPSVPPSGLLPAAIKPSLGLNGPQIIEWARVAAQDCLLEALPTP
ncbi:hypothetical protein BKK79_36625 (plasmid) [Cupriavidus sp. USMAA2-4]|nr:hypothetical protein BKK79_36625 [Cupriavidus sp. USMAA2-4]